MHVIIRNQKNRKKNNRHNSNQTNPNKQSDPQNLLNPSLLSFYPRHPTPPHPLLLPRRSPQLADIHRQLPAHPANPAITFPSSIRSTSLALCCAASPILPQILLVAGRRSWLPTVAGHSGCRHRHQSPTPSSTSPCSTFN